MKKKTLMILLVVIVILLGMVFKNNLIRLYVSLCHDTLENHATQALGTNERTTGRYGVWKTSCYPEDDLVEFSTGGWGLAPNSTYTGFYYSADNTHKPFSAAHSDAVSMEIDGDTATWTDGTDNHGTSTRITEKWFWYEASF